MSYHSPPQGVSIAGEACFALLIHSVLFRQVDKVGGEDEAEEANVQGGNQLLENTENCPEISELDCAEEEG